MNARLGGYCRALTRPASQAAGLAAVLLAACAAPSANAPVRITPAPLYSEPAQGNRATLVLRVVHPGGQYTLSTYEQPVSCSQRREFVSSTVREPDRISKQIVAGRLQTVGFLHVRTDRRLCEVIVSFEPARGRSYLMRSTGDAERCRVEIIDATAADAPREVPVLRRERNGYGLHDNACKPITSTGIKPPAAAASAAAAPARPSLDDFRDLLPRP
jgi:hypothetical protein